MSTPIKSSVTNRPGQGGVSGASEMVARLQAQARGAQAPSASQSFASLMSQQNAAAQAAPAPKAPAKAAERQAPSNDPAAKAQAAARAHEQTLTRARQQAQATQRAAQQAAQAAEQGAQAGKLPPQAQQAQAERAEVSRRAERPVESGKPGPAAEAERAAEAPESNREAKPVAGDPAGMMAWLAGMLPQAKPAALTGAEALAQAAQDPNADAELDLAELAELASTEADPAAQTGLGAEADGGVALDPSQWQQTTALAGLQVDAMLGRAGESALEAKGEAGALSGLAPGANVRAGGLTPAAAPRHESATLATPFGHADFSQALADKVSLWVNTARTDGPMTAELHLNPADMGPIQVKIALEGQSAQVDFAAAAAETRKAIEASLSALSSALSDVGLNLTGGGVTAQTAQQSFGQQSAPSEGARGVSTGSSTASAAEDEGDAAFMQGVSAPRAGRPGGLDLYA